MEQIQKLNRNNPWFKPAMVFLVKVSGVITISSLLGLFIGKKIDSYFSTSPVFLGICLLSGFVLSLFQIRNAIREYKKEVE